MNTFYQYLIPWSISQAASLLILFLAFRKPVWARYIFAAIFIAAGIFNWITSIRSPEAYMMYANTAVGFYRDFIDGWFKKHIRLLVPMIATGQLMIGAGMLASLESSSSDNGLNSFNVLFF